MTEIDKIIQKAIDDINNCSSAINNNNNEVILQLAKTKAYLKEELDKYKLAEQSLIV